MSREITHRRRRRPRHHGCRHRGGARPQRLRRRRRRGRRAATLTRGRDHVAELDRPGRRAGQAHRGRAARPCSAGSASPPTSRTSPTADLVVEAVPEHLDLKREIFGKLDTICGPDAILATNTSSLSVTEISVATAHPRRVVGMHFFNPAPVQTFVEVVRTVVTAQDVVDDVVALARAPRQAAGRRRRQGRLHRQRAAVRLPQPRRVDVRAALRHPRGHRRRDAARLRLPDGPARAAGPDRARHRLRDPRHDVQAGPRPPARADPDPQADGHRRPAAAARPAGASTPSEAGLLGRRRRRADARSTARREVRRRDPSRRVGVVGSGTMATGIVEVFAKAGYDVVVRGPRRGQGREAVARRSRRAWRRRCSAASSPRRPATRRSAGSPGRPSLDDLADVDLVVEAVVEDLVGQDGAVREPRRDLQAGRHPRHDHLARCRSSSAPRRPVARGTSSGCTSSTRRRS